MILGELKLDSFIGDPVDWDDIQFTYTLGKVTQIVLSLAGDTVKTVNLTYTGEDVTGVEIIYPTKSETITITYSGSEIDQVTKVIS